MRLCKQRIVSKRKQNSVKIFNSNNSTATFASISDNFVMDEPHDKGKKNFIIIVMLIISCYFIYFNYKLSLRLLLLQ